MIGGLNKFYRFVHQLADLQIAVKRLKVWSSKAEMEFAVEVEILGRARHKNLLSLRGYCAEGQERLIIYDFMPNLSLLSHLHGQFAADGHLDWRRRMHIALGSAEGIAYVCFGVYFHSRCESCITVQMVSLDEPQRVLKISFLLLQISSSLCNSSHYT